MKFSIIQVSINSENTLANEDTSKILIIPKKIYNKFIINTMYVGLKLCD